MLTLGGDLACGLLGDLVDALLRELPGSLIGDSAGVRVDLAGDILDLFSEEGQVAEALVVVEDELDF